MTEELNDSNAVATINVIAEVPTADERAVSLALLESFGSSTVRNLCHKFYSGRKLSSVSALWHSRDCDRLSVGKFPENDGAMSPSTTSAMSTLSVSLSCFALLHSKNYSRK